MQHTNDIVNENEKRDSCSLGVRALFFENIRSGIIRMEVKQMPNRGNLQHQLSVQWRQWDDGPGD